MLSGFRCQDHGDASMRQVVASDTYRALTYGEYKRVTIVVSTKQGKSQASQGSSCVLFFYHIYSITSQTP
jgi:hypothetical protein